MRILLLAIALLLPGCSWLSSTPLYTPSDAVQPLSAGAYRVAEAANRRTDSAHVTILDNGLTRVVGGVPHDEEALFGFIALDAAGRRFLVWQVPEGPAADAVDAYFYLIAERSPEGDFLFYVPACEGRNAELATAAGARIESDGGRRACLFADRTALERASRDAIFDRDRLLGRFIREPAGH
ncbi:MAG TPA: hypothetical protein VMG08_04730 [Allosphingosinicella sp.]|nr:hypothetical protein [Allosphingosinicella sp.]